MNEKEELGYTLYTGTKGKEMFDDYLKKQFSNPTKPRFEEYSLYESNLNIDYIPTNLPEKYIINGITIYRYECNKCYLYTFNEKYSELGEKIKILKSESTKEQVKIILDYLNNKIKLNKNLKKGKSIYSNSSVEYPKTPTESYRMDIMDVSSKSRNPFINTEIQEYITEYLKK